MMLRKNILVKTLALLALSSLPAAQAFALPLKVFEDLTLNAPTPVEIAHNESVLFQYEGWAFSEEILDPKTVIRGVDITGWSASFFKSLFEPEIRKQMPSWMAALSKSMAQEFSVADNNWRSKTVGPVQIFSIYSADIDQVDYFMIRDRTVASIQCVNDRAKCEDLFDRFVYSPVSDDN